MLYNVKCSLIFRRRIFYKNIQSLQERRIMKVYDLSAIPQEMLASVGGKAKGLCELNKFGFSVPKGFILVDANNAQDYEEAYKYYESQNLGKVAVRSSATIEDGTNFSNAGQYETFLNVSTREEFLNAVKDCIASLNNFRSQVYSKTFLTNEKAETENKMTVVVQQMVDAKCAGVLFTKDPMNPKAVLIECVSGLGESLVSGTQTAEQYKVEDGKILENENKILSEQEVLSLYQSALKAEKDFGKPMDMEWAMDKEGNIRFVQARPITVEATDEVTINEFDFPHDVTDKIITTCNVREMLSCAVTPLTMSTSCFGLDYGMRKMMEKNHSIKHVDDLPPFSCITPFYNNMFFNQTTNYIVSYRIAGTSKESSDVVICGRVLEEFPDKFSDPSPQIVRIARMAFFLPYILSGKKAVNGMQQVIDNLHFNYDDTLEGLYKQTEDNFDLLKEAWFCHYCSSYFSGAASMMASSALTKILGDYNKASFLLSGALTNIEGIESAKIVDMMKELGRVIVKNNPDSVNYTKEQLAEYISGATGEVKDTYDNFMKINGHRGINESEMRVKCWGDDLVGFCEALKGSIVSIGKDDIVKTKDWTDYVDEIMALVKPSKRKGIKSQILKARQGAWTREHTKSRCIQVTNGFRKAYNLIAEKMVEKGMLPDKDLIFFLTKEEIGKVIAGDNSLIKKAMKRRRLYPIQCSLRFEEVYSGKPIPIQDEVALDKSDFQGTPASPGIVTGKARVIRSVDDANKLQEGEIMVVSLTDVGWTPYYCLASGLITEIGSCLSHGVVVAREYGLPTIVSVKDIMRSIKDGDVITMDGTRGTVTLVSKEEE